MRVPAPDRISDFPQVGSVIAEKYCVERVLGSGSMGTVFCATHVMTGRRFALKWMNAAASDGEALRERFIREFQTAGSIVHANVASVLDAGAQAGELYIVMEYLEGESLAARVARGPMPVSECVPIVMEAMRGVAAGHRHDVVHLDLKPENIFICESPGRERPEIKVLDFGVMKAVNARASLLSKLTERETPVGTPAYMAPEQVLGQASMDQRVDVYALGVILYQALSGELPFVAETGVRLFERIVQGSPTPLWSVAPFLPDGLAEVVMRALERDPDRRYDSVDGFAAALWPWAADADFGPRTARATEPMDTRAYRSVHRDSGSRLREFVTPDHAEREQLEESAHPAGEELADPDEAYLAVELPEHEDAGPWSEQTERLHLPVRRRSNTSLLLTMAAFFVAAAAWGLLHGWPDRTDATGAPAPAETQPSAATDPAPPSAETVANEPEPPSAAHVVALPSASPLPAASVDDPASTEAIEAPAPATTAEPPPLLLSPPSAEVVEAASPATNAEPPPVVQLPPSAEPSAPEPVQAATPSPAVPTTPQAAPPAHTAKPLPPSAAPTSADPPRAETGRSDKSARKTAGLSVSDF